ncbi:hypothetical protein PR001_g33953 [Phytophthora rubi]|uniref:Secreted protein n=1 Tax=Phytophthora rubi TaxID=129364 RepID=A0A6A3G0F3_9STRA|nr:hypothetical protein PR001_g33953 [Phytophthora rubi]KAE8950932.1 hypothetical protein PR002_g33130 [Phytophthora rubi]
MKSTVCLCFLFLACCKRVLRLGIDPARGMICWFARRRSTACRSSPAFPGFLTGRAGLAQRLDSFRYTQPRATSDSLNCFIHSRSAGAYVRDRQRIGTVPSLNRISKGSIFDGGSLPILRRQMSYRVTTS